MPVDSTTTSTPSSPQGRFSGSRSHRTFDGMAVGHEAILGDLDRIEGAAVDRVILQQVSHRRDVAEVVDGDDLDLRDP